MVTGKEGCFKKDEILGVIYGRLVKVLTKAKYEKRLTMFNPQE